MTFSNRNELKSLTNFPTIMTNDYKLHFYFRDVYIIHLLPTYCFQYHNLSINIYTRVLYILRTIKLFHIFTSLQQVGNTIFIKLHF